MISLKPAYVTRYTAIAKLLLRHGRSDVVRQIGLEPMLGHAVDVKPPADGDGPVTLARDLEQLGPTFIKLGQLLSTRADVLPPEYLDALARLQDKAEPIPVGVVESTIEAELGVRISKAFAEFDSTPLAAASIGQVHRARLRDGTAVAVKVQRPNLRQQVFDDLGAMQELGHLLDDHTAFGRRIRFVQLVEALREVMLKELDYRQEAENGRTLKHNLREFDRFVVPRVIDDYTSEKVITLEFVEGAKITDVSQVVLIELDRCELADQVFRAYLHQVLIDGVFHADPHPGNLMLTPDHRIGLVDFGMVATVTPELARRLLKLFIAVGEGRGEEAAREAVAIGRPYPGEVFEEDEFRERVAKLVMANHAKPLSELHVGGVVMDVNALAGESGLKLPTAVLMLGKTLLNLDKVVEVLDPQFDPHAALDRHLESILSRQGARHLSRGRIYQTLLESAEFIERMPERANKLAEVLANNRLRLEVDAFDEPKLLAGLQKIANRITTGLILAALIIGASLMMRLDLEPKWFGYPAIAVVFLLLAAVTAGTMLWSAARRDESPK